VLGLEPVGQAAAAVSGPGCSSRAGPPALVITTVEADAANAAPYEQAPGHTTPRWKPVPEGLVPDQTVSDQEQFYPHAWNDVQRRWVGVSREPADPRGGHSKRASTL
jgi:hypothetical protein